MATVIHNDSPASSEGSGVGTVVAVILALVILGLLFFYGVPYFRGANNSPDTLNVNVEGNLPAPGGEPGPSY